MRRKTSASRIRDVRCLCYTWPRSPPWAPLSVASPPPPPVVQCCYRGVTVVLQWCDSGVTVVLQWCYSGVTVVLQWCCSGVTVVLQWCYSGVTVVLQWCNSGVTVVLQWCSGGVAGVLQWCQMFLPVPPPLLAPHHRCRTRIPSQIRWSSRQGYGRKGVQKSEYSTRDNDTQSEFAYAHTHTHAHNHYLQKHPTWTLLHKDANVIRKCKWCDL
jgi:hypothetical protein